MQTFNEIQNRLSEVASSQESWAEFKKELETDSINDVVNVELEVSYNKLTHGMEMVAKVTTKDPNVYLMQIWLQDINLGFWIPELHPWVLSGVEFQRENRINSALCGLIDHKWRKDDRGAKYEVLVWGYAEQNGTDVKFGPVVQKFEYPELSV